MDLHIFIKGAYHKLTDPKLSTDGSDGNSQLWVKHASAHGLTTDGAITFPTILPLLAFFH